MMPKIESAYLQTNLNTIKNVRKLYNLHTPEALDQAISVLNDWIMKQEHFMKKDLPRDYLERYIISAKGSVEIAKKRIDRLFSMQTTIPHLFKKCHPIKESPELRNHYVNVMMLRMLEDDSRLFVGKVMCRSVKPSVCSDAYQHLRIIFEYVKLHDYAKGLHIIYDLNDFDIADALTKLDLVELQNAASMSIEAYGCKILSVYIISTSTMINVAISILKRMLSEKVGKKIKVVKTMESLHQFIPKQFLPEEFGGEQKSLLELYDEMNEALSSEKHVAHMKEMRRARTNEELRRVDRCSKEHLGTPGSFKMLCVD